MKILLSSNTPWGVSGYSTQAQLLLRMLQEMGHEVQLYAWYGFQGQVTQINGITVWPQLHHQYGGDADYIAGQAKVDLVLSLQDIWPLPEGMGDGIRKAGAKWLAYFPIDGTPVPPKVAERAQEADVRVVYSQFALDEMKFAGLDAAYAPHMIDLDLFTPGDKLAVRRRLGIPENAYLVLMVATNRGLPGRKSLAESMEAFGRFRQRHPEAVLFLHTAKTQPLRLGLDLGRLADLLGLNGSVQFIRQDEYRMGAIPQGFMVDLYRAADVLLNPSMGEGFGLPLLEAQACGCPVISQNCTSMAELTANGLAITPAQRQYTGLGHFQFVADVAEIDTALERICCRSAEAAEAKRQQGLKLARRYERQHVAETYWRPILEAIE